MYIHTVNVGRHACIIMDFSFTGVDDPYKSLEGVISVDNDNEIG